MDLLLNGTKTASSWVRHVLGFVSGALVGVGVWSASDADSAMSLVTTFFSHADGILGTAGMIVTFAAATFSKTKKWLGIGE
jgi:hypothetical protein